MDRVDKGLAEAGADVGESVDRLHDPGMDRAVKGVDQSRTSFTT